MPSQVMADVMAHRCIAQQTRSMFGSDAAHTDGV
jgi:hypothetical protein